MVPATQKVGAGGTAVVCAASVARRARAMPDRVIDAVGYALHLAQKGLKSDQAKALKGFGSAGVLEVVEDDDGNTYRAVYTVRFKNAVYVLHCFQKKSHKGISTPKHEMDIVEGRLKLAKQNSEGAGS